MSASAIALAGYVGWTLTLLGVIAVLRSTLTVSGQREANSFSPDGSDVSPFSHRLCRAHANCYENLPIFGCLILLALVTGNEAVTDPLALPVLAARVGQSTIHLASTSSRAVQVRFAFFLVQYLVEAWWFVQLVAALRSS